MEFDNTKFNTASFNRRTKEIPVTNPGLLKFFTNGSQPAEVADDKGGDKDRPQPCLVVQNLSAMELSLANAEVTNRSRRDSMVEALLSGAGHEIKSAVKQMTGMPETGMPSDNLEPPEDYIRRQVQVLYGSVTPKFEDLMQVQRFATMFPVVFYDMSNTIMVLTGLGMDLGE